MQMEEMSFPFQECRGQIGECAPCRLSSLLCLGSVTLYPPRPAGEAQICSFFPLRGAALLSQTLQRSRFSLLEALIGLSPSYFYRQSLVLIASFPALVMFPTNLNRSVQHSSSPILPTSLTSIPNAGLF